MIQENNYMVNDLAARAKQELVPGQVVRSQQQGHDFLFVCENNVQLQLQVITDKILRFRYATEVGFAPDFSYAIPADRPRQAPQFLEFREKPDHYRITTDRLICTVSKENLHVRILDRSGTVLSDDDKGFHWQHNDDTGNDIVKMSKQVQSGVCYYGLGDKPENMNLRGKRFVNWGSDTYGYVKGSDPLYKNIPFYLELHQKIAHGIFFDNSFKAFFDFAAERADVTSFWAEGGEMNYYFIYGPTLTEVTEEYTRLTCPPELPPMWALGYHQCKWSYFPESNVKEIAAGFRERQIPCDALYLDIDYMDGYRCFTWSPTHFPEPKRMIKELAEDGFKLVVIIDPGIKIDPEYPVYNEALEQDFFCRRADGPLMRGSVWPGLCNFPDYTKPAVREWWSGLFKGLIQEDGVRGVWNDMNEPAVFEKGTFPDDVRFHYEGHSASHKKAHNVYGMQMARATAAGVKRFSYPNRPFTITRSTYAGGQRYSSAWTGDNIASWEHLWLANIQCQRLSISGFSFVGSDVGGFVETPDGELYVRWVALAAFHPFFRTHSSGDHGDQEPWSFGDEYMTLARHFISLRYRLLPYMYTTFWQYVQNGTPMLRPLAFLDQNDTDTYLRMAEFSLGDHLLVCPITTPGVDGRWMYLPKGQWYYYWTNEVRSGGAEVWASANLDRIPLFVRAGAVIPFYPLMQYVGEKVVEELTLHVYYKNGKEASVLYDDGGEGYAYQEGQSTTRRFTVSGTETTLTLKQEIEGEYKPSFATYKVVLHGLPFETTAQTVDGETVKLDEHITDTGLTLPSMTVGVGFGEVMLKGNVTPVVAS
ncbi:glycoside hydrolase family 31 protein [Hymenobacter sp. GOD-10R]|uniref:glycoside hydrolase family 31 protein n=1 Tax=Hymenobacter sp. GOD-10R TaxID=3093922 RepID=UPI002D77217C|nr:glycoside hydrolase family 31 protein [Hymenobacter sp. GOD-10R]WRQ29933.1 glycoside hydrolase family 31 protein [Hymenobacter sp. GOD-10R]